MGLVKRSDRVDIVPTAQGKPQIQPNGGVILLDWTARSDRVKIAKSPNCPIDPSFMIIRPKLLSNSERIQVKKFQFF